MALPALHALSEVGEVTIHAPRWGGELYRDVRARVMPRGRMAGGDVAILFAPSLRAALEAWRLPRRVGVASDHRGWLLTDRVAPGRHQGETYTRLAAAVGATKDPEAAPVSPAYLQKLVERIAQAVAAASKGGQEAVVLARANVRRFLNELVRATLPRVAVLSYNEVVPARAVETTAVVKVEE